MTEPRYTHMVCGQCYQWHAIGPCPIGPCPAPPAMTDDERARALLMETWHRSRMQPNYQYKTLDQWLDECVPIIAAYGREERRRALEGVRRMFEQQTEFYGQESDMRKYLDGMIAWCRQQAREEENT